MSACLNVGEPYQVLHGGKLRTLVYKGTELRKEGCFLAFTDEAWSEYLEFPAPTITVQSLLVVTSAVEEVK